MKRYYRSILVVKKQKEKKISNYNISANPAPTHIIHTYTHTHIYIYIVTFTFFLGKSLQGGGAIFFTLFNSNITSFIILNKKQINIKYVHFDKPSRDQNSETTLLSVCWYVCIEHEPKRRNR